MAWLAGDPLYSAVGQCGPWWGGEKHSNVGAQMESTSCPRANDRFVLHPVGEDGDKGILGTEKGPECQLRNHEV